MPAEIELNEYQEEAMDKAWAMIHQENSDRRAKEKAAKMAQEKLHSPGQPSDDFATVDPDAADENDRY